MQRLPMKRQAGWVLQDPALLLPDDDGGLTWLDAQGQTRGRLGPDLAQDCCRRLGGGEDSPLLRALRAHGACPSLAEARRLSPSALLRREGWGLLFCELTSTCNERCAHCYAESGPQRREALDEATVRALIGEAAALGFRTIQFTGGEALLCPFLEDLVDCAFAAGLDVEVYTNGTLLSPTRYARLARAAFAFSLYARDPAVHDEITGLPGSHAKTLAGVSRALAGGSRVRVSVVLTRPQDLAEARAAAELARELGVGQVGADLSRAVGRGGDEGFAIQPREDAQSPLLPAEAGSEQAGLHRGSAASERGTAAVLPDGRVVPCILNRELVLGRVGPSGGLRAALETPAVELRAPAPLDELAASLREGGERLTCAACRLADALLRPREGA